MAAADPTPASDAEIEQQVLRRTWLTSLAFLASIAVINALTQTTELQRDGAPFDPRKPWVLEVTSILVIVALVPAIAWFERRFPFAPNTWRTAILWHLLGSAIFSALHILGMWLLRTAAFAAMGRPYQFLTDPLADALYEYRKDLLPYAIIVLLLGLTRGLEEHKREAAAARAEARETGRLTLKSGGRIVFLDAKSLDHASAAGNYVEIRANGVTHLARLSLAALEEQLRDAGVDVARVHRSHLVNRAKVREIVPAGDGDFRVKMADGADLRGSRRFRHTLPA